MQVNESEVLEACQWTPQKIVALSSTKAQQVILATGQFQPHHAETTLGRVRCNRLMHHSVCCMDAAKPAGTSGDSSCLQVNCSLDSSLVLTATREGSQILTFGDNSLGQLGQKEQHTERSKAGPHDWAVCGTDNKPLSALSITAGLSHCMAVLSSGQVSRSSLLTMQ